ncbi:MAG: TIGR04219 family outer membrane beta-barrel protein [Pseudomonadota bacterium]
MITRSLTAACLLAPWLAAGAQADTLFGIYAGAGKWQQNYEGDFASQGTAIDLEDDLDIDDEDNNVAYLALEHGVPVMPNVRANYADISGSGSSTLSRTITFRGEQFNVTQAVSSEVDFEQVDAIAYYEVLDNVVSLDLGVGARWVDGHVEVVSPTQSGRADFEGTLPMLYGRARFDLPLTGLWLGGDLMGLTYDDHDLLDATVQVGWESAVGLGAEVGYRTYRLDLDDIDEIDGADIDINGPYAAINYHF